jgi:5-methylcytosine-specific restriction endonuclease McrA
MNYVNDNGLLKYSLGKLETFLGRDVFWLLRECQDAIKTKLTYSEDYIEQDSYINFIKWYNKAYSESVQVPMVNKRAYSVTHRIEIAYKTKYNCGMCDMLLPPTFEIDHIIELRDGGTDTYDNLWALCNNCHAKKTRANTLKRDKAFEKEFGKQGREIEKLAFEKFNHVKKSRYF